MSDAACDAIIADFAWFPMRCNEPAAGLVTVDGVEYAACPQHGGTP